MTDRICIDLITGCFSWYAQKWKWSSLLWATSFWGSCLQARRQCVSPIWSSEAIYCQDWQDVEGFQVCCYNKSIFLFVKNMTSSLEFYCCTPETSDPSREVTWTKQQNLLCWNYTLVPSIQWHQLTRWHYILEEMQFGIILKWWLAGNHLSVWVLIHRVCKTMEFHGQTA